MSARAAVAGVRRYYEDNTRLFRVLGVGGRVRAVRRALWDSAATLEDALQRVNDLALAEIVAIAGAVEPLRLLDLGCGLGGSLAYFARALPDAELAGVTISRSQARIARRALAAARAVIVEGDFLELPFAPVFHAALAVESFAHAPDPARCYAQAGLAVASGGALIVCDDFLAREPVTIEEARWLAAFRSGWQVAGLQTTAAAVAQARAAGLRLRSERDLSAALRLHTLAPPLAATARALTGALGRLHPFAYSVRGSLALQECLARGLVRYRLLVFERW